MIIDQDSFIFVSDSFPSSPQGDQGEPGDTGSDGRPGDKVRIRFNLSRVIFDAICLCCTLVC